MSSMRTSAAWFKWAQTCLLFLVLFHAAAPRAGIIKTDIVFVADVSGSLISGSLPNLRTVIPDLAARFSALGVDARYGLVTFQAEAYMPHVTANLTDAVGLQNAFADPLLARYSGDEMYTPTVDLPVPYETRFRSRPGGENPYDALGVALNGMLNLERTRTEVVFNTDKNMFEAITATFTTGPQPELINYRPDAIKNLVLLTDEPPQETPLATLTTGPSYALGDPRGPWGNVLDLALQQNALINVIVDTSNVSETDTYYRPIADATGGNVFDLGQLSANDPVLLSDFVQDFADTKFQELVDVCLASPAAAGCEEFEVGAGPGAVPEPPVWTLLAGGLLSMRLFRRVRDAAC